MAGVEFGFVPPDATVCARSIAAKMMKNGALLSDIACHLRILDR
jgi:hypothetical protein